MSSNALVAGDTGANWFTKFNANDARIDAEVARAEAAEAALSAALATLSAAVYQPPQGAYAAPAAGGAFKYSSNSTPWTAATLQNRASTAAVAQTNLVSAGVLACPWGSNAVAVLAASSSTTGVTNGVLTIQAFRFALDGSGNPTLAGSITVQTGVNSSSGMTTNGAPISMVAVSATQVRVVYQSGWGGSFATGMLTWDPVGLVLSWASGGSYAFQNYNSFPSGTGRRQGFLCGVSSWVMTMAQGYTAGEQIAGSSICDRNNTAVFSPVGVGMTNVAITGQTTISSGYAEEYLGGGFSLAVEAMNAPADATNRVVVQLKYTDDYNTDILAYLRIPARTWGGSLTVIPFSNTAAMVTWTDASAQKWAALVTINTAAGTIGLVNTYSVGNFNTVAFGGLFANFNANNLFVVGPVVGNQAATLMNVSLNMASMGSEIASAAANNIPFNTGPGSAGANNIFSAFTLSANPNQLVVVGYYSGTRIVYCETWNLA